MPEMEQAAKTDNTVSQQAQTNTLPQEMQNLLGEYGYKYCSHCGRCPHCGRPYHYEPLSPYDPSPYYIPPYYPSTISSQVVGPTNSGNMIGGGHA